MTVTIIEHEISLFDSIDTTIKCFAYMDDRCGEAASWLLLKSCGCDVPLCDMHKKICEEELTGRSIDSTASYFCSMCGGEYHPNYRWERI